MTDIEKAMAMLKPGACCQVNVENMATLIAALKSAIEQHEAFRQEVSDIVRHYACGYGGPDDWEKLKALIIPKPKPDPLVAAMADCGVDRFESWADQLRAALDARGFEIREKNDD